MNVLLIRGLAREARHWGRFPALVEERFEGSRAHSLDLPGVGTESHRKSPVTMDGIVDDIRGRWLQIDGGQSPWLCFGISFGGMVAMNWISRYPRDFTRAILANTSAMNLGLPHERLTPKGIAGLFKTIRTKDAFERERTILGVISNDATQRDEVARQWARIATENPIGRGLVLRQIAAASRYPAPKSLPIPAMVMAATNDRFVSVQCSLRLARRLGAQLEIHPTAGHSLAVDAPDWMAEKIAQFARLSPRGH